jgi:hypothetical protein
VDPSGCRRWYPGCLVGLRLLVLSVYMTDEMQRTLVNYHHSGMPNLAFIFVVQLLMIRAGNLPNMPLPISPPSTDLTLSPTTALI